MMRVRLSDVFLSAVVLFTVACNGDEDGEAGGDGDGLIATGDGPCESPSDCEGGVCVGLIDGDHPPIYCSQECGACPGGFYCDADTFALVELAFCRFGDGVEPQPPSEPPRRPCTSDTECAPGICAEHAGQRDCTIECAAEEACTPPSVGGVALDVFSCQPDEAAERTACLPDPACFPDPTSCIDGFGL